MVQVGGTEIVGGVVSGDDIEGVLPPRDDDGRQRRRSCQSHPPLLLRPLVAFLYPSYINSETTPLPDVKFSYTRIIGVIILENVYTFIIYHSLNISLYTK